MRVEILSLAFRMISSSSIGVPSTPNFVKAMRINFQNMKCIIEIPCGRTLPVERTPSRLIKRSVVPVLGIVKQP